MIGRGLRDAPTGGKAAIAGHATLPPQGMLAYPTPISPYLPQAVIGRTVAGKKSR